VLRRSRPEPWRVVGPYYARDAAVVPVTDDVFVVFGDSDSSVSFPSDPELVELAAFASETLIEVEAAKRLADEVETLNAVRDLLQAPAGTFQEALQSLVAQATSALSCDLGLAYVRDPELTAVCDLREDAASSRNGVLEALRAVADRGRFPVCVQEATADELPEPFRSDDGVLAYYLLELADPKPGVLLLLHTRAARARGFTALCQQLGARLVESAVPLLQAGLLRDSLNQQLDSAAAQARREPLTGVGNRLAWDEAMAAADPTIASPVSIVKVDCRGLKHVNDTRGHHIGDQLLKEVAALLDASSRENDLVARLGGDEFGILLVGADEEIAQSVVRRVEAALGASSRAGQIEINLAIGTATTREPDVEEAHRRADLDMVEAKRLP